MSLDEKKGKKKAKEKSASKKKSTSNEKLTIKEKFATKELILEVAKEEFLKKGFHEASLRNIVEGAGVTTGSFYWHFKSKEELFDSLVSEHYHYIMQVYGRFVEYSNSLPIMERLDKMKEISLQCVNNILEYMYAHLTEFKILIDSSMGTKYENFLHELVESEISDTDKFSQILKEHGISVREVSKETEHILVSGMFTSIFELVTHDFPIEKARLCTKDLVDFYTAGWFCLMNLDDKK